MFVVALAQLSHGLIEDLTWSGAFQTLVLLLAMWWVWSGTAFVTDLYDPQRPAIQLLVIATMLGSLVMVVALPDAFGERGLVFAGTYVAIQVGRELFLVLALRGHELQSRSVRVLFWFGVSAVPWIAGALAHGAARGALWTLAVAVDYTARGSRFPTPGLGRSPESEYPIAAEHLAERYRQLFVIALGELILVTALTLSGSGFAADRTAAFVVSFVGHGAVLADLHLPRSGELLPAAIAAAPHPDRLAVSALYRPPAHDGRHRRDRGGRRTRHRPSTRAHTAGLGRRHPRRARAVPGRAFLLRVRGVQPRVPGPRPSGCSCWSP